MRLGVNIDHVATVREARKTFEPSPLFAALLAESAGADQITMHLREDRRHVKDEDLELIKRAIKVPLNLEMAPTKEMKEIALRVRPNRITLVPERRQEITTEGGLDVLSLKENLKDFIKPFKEVGIEVSLFVEPDLKVIEVSKEVGADAIEIHTGRYANLYNEKKFKEAYEEIQRIKKASLKAKELGLRVYAGHGLNYQNVKLFVRELRGFVEELSIGHSIVANAVLFGFERAVKEMLNLIRG